MKKSNFKKVKKNIRIRTIFFLALALSCNTFAWFVYNTRVENSITTTVKAWRVRFESDDEIVQQVEFKIDSLYPGMPNYQNSIDITNQGETDAIISYTIESINILGEVYEGYTNDQLLNMLNNDFPFLISFSASNPIVTVNGKEKFLINVTWPYESGDDELDTLWGTKAYTFKEMNPSTPGIIIKIKLSASQKND